MRRIIEILGVEPRKDRHGKRYYRTHAVLDDGSEVVGWGRDFQINDLVESFFHREVHKMRKTINPIDKA